MKKGQETGTINSDLLYKWLPSIMSSRIWQATDYILIMMLTFLIHIMIQRDIYK